jgi:hypothetical protein
MKSYDGLITSVYVMIQLLDNHHSNLNTDHKETDAETKERIKIIIDTVNDSPSEQRKQWLRHLLTTVEHIFDVNPQVTQHELFTQNPIDSARKYIDFEKQEDNKSLT